MQGSLRQREGSGLAPRGLRPGCEGRARRTPGCSSPCSGAAHPPTLAAAQPPWLSRGQELPVAPAVLTVPYVGENPRHQVRGQNKPSREAGSILTWAPPRSWKMRLKAAICFPMLGGK